MSLLTQLGVSNPVVLAPLGGSGTAELAAAVAEAGGFGFLPGQYLPPERIREQAARLRDLIGTRSFGINLFAPVEAPATPGNPEPAMERLRTFHEELGIPAPALPPEAADDFERKLEACLESGARVFSFTFGIPPEEVISDIKARGMLFVGTATTVEEALLLEEAGADAVVAQGSEAGGHRGTFAGSFEDAMIGTIALVPQVVDAVSVPVLASGGIMDGRGIAAALALGAQAVQMGTAFLTSQEASVPQVYKQALLNAFEHETTVTRAFSGRPARGLRNRVIDELEEDPRAILPYPFQNHLTRPMRNAAASLADPDYLSLWAGQGVGMARSGPAGDLVRALLAETRAAIERLGGIRLG